MSKEKRMAGLWEIPEGWSELNLDTFEYLNLSNPVLGDMVRELSLELKEASDEEAQRKQQAQGSTGSEREGSEGVA